MHQTPQPSREVLRHSAGVRWLHWLLALTFIVAMLSGLCLYWASILKWMQPLFGGKVWTVRLHFWFGIALTLVTALLYGTWKAWMKWSAADSYFVRHLKDHAMSPDQEPPPDTGYFNGGQKLYFWSVVVSVGILFVTGLVWWFRPYLPHTLYAVCRTTHRVVGVIMSAALLVHVYKATIGEPGTFRSMITGKVTLEWARKRRPQWFRDQGGS